MMYDQPQAPIVVCLDCSPHERIALNFLQEKRKIRNINALAVVMGNIKQESRFDHLVCEGGQRTGYKKCHSGGFGLIQWTTTARYIGLGKFCAKYDLNPDHFMSQLRYMVNENQWVRYGSICYHLGNLLTIICATLIIGWVGVFMETVPIMPTIMSIGSVWL